MLRASSKAPQTNSCLVQDANNIIEDSKQRSSTTHNRENRTKQHEDINQEENEQKDRNSSLGQVEFVSEPLSNETKKTEKKPKMLSFFKKTLIISGILVFILIAVAGVLILHFVGLDGHSNNSNNTLPSADGNQTTSLPPLIDPAANNTDIDAEFPAEYPDRTAEELATWRDWKRKYRRTYNNDRSETLKRQSIFLNNLRWINSFNSNKKRLYKLSANHFADMMPAEINNLFIGPSIQWADTLRPLGDPNQYQIVGISGDDSSQPRSEPVDWRNSAGPILNQQTCRAGAVYASVANIESYYNLVNSSKQVRLSEKQVLDCLMLESAQKQLANACAGGVSAVSVYQNLQRLSAGLSSQQNYNAYLSSLKPADSQHPICILEASNDEPRVKVVSFGVVNKENITDALTLMGPLTVGIDATRSTFHFYSSGVYHDETCDTNTYNHHMLIVGHSPAIVETVINDDQPPSLSPSPLPTNATNTTNLIKNSAPTNAKVTTKTISPEHLLMKNSFGTDWGENGYVRILVDPIKNKCMPQGIATYPNILFSDKN